MTKNQKTATVAVINPDKRLLILLRGPTAPWMPLRYCLPGGHVENNEYLSYTACRELSEETGISYPVDQLSTIDIKYSADYSKTVWVARIDHDNVILNWEHDEYKWISYDESFSLDLVPGLMTTIKTLHNLRLIT